MMDSDYLRLNLFFAVLLVGLGIIGFCGGIYIGDQILHEQTQTITVAMVDVFSHQVMDAEGTVWTLNTNSLEMQLIHPGDNLTLSWQGGVWFADSATPAEVISGLRDPSEIVQPTCQESEG